MKKLIYLALPYSGQIATSFEICCRRTIELLNAKQDVFSPVFYGHSLVTMAKEQGFNLVMNTKRWYSLDLNIMSACSVLWIICIPGWTQSKGIELELNHARKNGFTIIYDENNSDVETLLRKNGLL